MTDAERIQYLQGELLGLAKAISVGTAGKIDAIKAYRAATGSTLKDSKDWVEALASATEGGQQNSDRISNLERRVAELERQARFPIFGIT